jgi:hypothetical protein
MLEQNSRRKSKNVRMWPARRNYARTFFVYRILKDASAIMIGSRDV